VTPKQPAATAKDLVRVAERLGFVFRRQRGAMRFMSCSGAGGPIQKIEGATGV